MQPLRLQLLQLHSAGVAALDGNHRSAEVCRKILAQQVLVYGLGQEVSFAGAQPDAVEFDPEPDPDDPEGLGVLERMRRGRARPYC